MFDHWARAQAAAQEAVLRLLTQTGPYQTGLDLDPHSSDRPGHNASGGGRKGAGCFSRGRDGAKVEGGVEGACGDDEESSGGDQASSGSGDGHASSSPAQALLSDGLRLGFGLEDVSVVLDQLPDRLVARNADQLRAWLACLRPAPPTHGPGPGGGGGGGGSASSDGLGTLARQLRQAVVRFLLISDSDSDSSLSGLARRRSNLVVKRNGVFELPAL